MWHKHLLSCGSKHDHKDFPMKGVDTPCGCISTFYSKLLLTMVGGTYHKPVRWNFTVFYKSQISMVPKRYLDELSAESMDYYEYIQTCV